MKLLDTRMTHQVPWNKVILEEFIRIGCLSKTEEMIMRTRDKSKSVSTLLDTKNCIKNKISCCKIFLARLIYLCSCFFQLYNDD